MATYEDKSASEVIEKLREDAEELRTRIVNLRKDLAETEGGYIDDVFSQIAWADEHAGRLTESLRRAHEVSIERDAMIEGEIADYDRGAEMSAIPPEDDP